MRRRLDLAAALVHRPPVLFLDEPTTGLDPRSRTDLWRVISQLVREGTTVLLTTQYLEEADLLADRIVVIDQGEVIAQGTSSELKATVGATIIEIDLADPANAQRARSALAEHGMCDVEIDGHTVELKVDDGSRAAVDVVRTLDREGLEPVSLSLREPTLDDVFLTITGHARPRNRLRRRAGGRRRARSAARCRMTTTTITPPDARTAAAQPARLGDRRHQGHRLAQPRDPAAACPSCSCSRRSSR